MISNKDKLAFGSILAGMVFAGITQNTAMATVLSSILISIAILETKGKSLMSSQPLRSYKPE